MNGVTPRVRIRPPRAAGAGEREEERAPEADTRAWIEELVRLSSGGTPAAAGNAALLAAAAVDRAQSEPATKSAAAPSKPAAPPEPVEPEPAPAGPSANVERGAAREPFADPAISREAAAERGARPEPREPLAPDEALARSSATDGARPRESARALHESLHRALPRTPAQAPPETQTERAEQTARIAESAAGAERAVEAAGAPTEAARAAAGEASAKPGAAEAGTEPGAAEAGAEPGAAEPGAAPAAPRAPARARPRGGGGDARGASQARAWRSGLQARIRRIPEPDFSSVVDGPSELRARGARAAGERRQRARRIPEEGREQIPERPELEQPLPEPEPDPVPSATALVEAASNQRLPDQELPELQTSPGGFRPRLVQAPPGAHARGARFTIEIEAVPEPAAEADARTEDPSRASSEARERTERALDTEPGAAEQAAAAPLRLVDEGAPPPPQFTEAERADIGRVIARLFDDTEGSARDALADARTQAYPRGRLQELDTSYGDDLLPRFRAELEAELRGIAAEAGIGAAELDQAIEERRAERERLAEEHGEAVHEAADEAEAEVEAAAAEEESATVSTFDRLQDWLDAQVVAASSGNTDPAAVRAERDRLIRALMRKVSEQTTAYRQQGDRRDRGLDAANRAIMMAYRQVADRDRERFLEQAGDDPDARAAAEERAEESATWARRRWQEASAVIEQHRTAAQAAVRRFTREIERAGSEGTQQIRDWALERMGAEMNWLQRLIQRVIDWAQQSRTNVDTWSAAQRQESAQAIAGDLALLRDLRTSRAAGVEFRALAEAGQVSAEQAAVVQTYFGEPPDAGNAIAAVAAGMRMRLRKQRAREIAETLRERVRAMDEYDFLDQIGDAQRPGFSSAHLVSELYAAMHGGLTGWGTEESRVYAALTGLTPEQARAVRLRYRAEKGRDLDDDIAEEFSGNERRRAEALLRGDQAAADAAALYEAMHGGVTGWGTDEAEIMRTLRSKSEEERERIAEEYRRISGRDLEDDLQSEMEGNDLRQAEAHLAGNTALADAIAIESAMSDTFLGTGWGTGEDEIAGVYGQIREEVIAQARREGWSAERMEAEVLRRNREVEREFGGAFANRYEAAEGQSTLAAAFASEAEGADLRLFTALSENDQTAAEAARLEGEFTSFVTDDDAVLARMDETEERARLHVELDAEHRMRETIADETFRTGEPPDEERIRELERARDAEVEAQLPEVAQRYMRGVEQVFDEKWGYSGALRLRIAFNVSGVDQEAAYTRLSQGHLRPEQEIEFAIREDDESRVVAVIQRLTPEQRQRMRERYDSEPGRGSGAFDRLLDSELEGRDAQDAHYAMLPETEDPDELLAREEARVLWELENQGAFWAGSERATLERRLQELRDRRERLRTASPDDPRIGFYRRSFHSGVAEVEDGVRAFREGIDSGLDTLLTVVSATIGIIALIAAAVATVVTGGAAAPLLIAVGGALLSAVATIGTKQAVLGSAYTSEALITDIAVGVVDVVVAAATAGLGARLLQTGRLAALAGRGAWSKLAAAGIAEGIESVAGSAPSAITGLLLDDNLWQSADTAGDFASGLGTAVAMSLAMDAVMSPASSRMMNWASGVRQARLARKLGLDPSVHPPSEVTAPRGEVPEIPERAAAPEIPERAAAPVPSVPEPRLEPLAMDGAGVRAAAEGEAAAEVERVREREDVRARDESGLPGNAEQRAALYRRFQREQPGASWERFLRALEQGEVSFREADAEVRRLRQEMRQELLADLPPGVRAQFEDVPIVVLADAEFARLTRSHSGDAVLLIENGRPRIVVREGAKLNVLREEGVHLEQFADPATRARMLELDEARLRDWDDLPPDEQLRLYRLKIELEIDAYERLLARLDVEIAASPDPAARRRLQAERAGYERTLENLRDRLGTLDALDPRERAAISSGQARPDYLEQAARLFAKRDPIDTLPELHRERARSVIDALPEADRASARRLLAAVHEVSGEAGLRHALELMSMGLGPNDVRLLMRRAAALPAADAAAFLDNARAVLEFLPPGQRAALVHQVRERRPGRTPTLAPEYLELAARMARAAAEIDELPPNVAALVRRRLGLPDSGAPDLQTIGATRILASSGEGMQWRNATDYLEAIANVAQRRVPNLPALVHAADAAGDPAHALLVLADLQTVYGVRPDTVLVVAETAAGRGTGMERFLDEAKALAAAIPDPELRDSFLLAAHHATSPRDLQNLRALHDGLLSSSSEHPLRADKRQRLEQALRDRARDAADPKTGEEAAHDLMDAGKGIGSGVVPGLRDRLLANEPLIDPEASTAPLHEREGARYLDRHENPKDVADHRALSDLLESLPETVSPEQRGMIWRWRRAITAMAPTDLGAFVQRLHDGLDLTTAAGQEVFRRRLRSEALRYIFLQPPASQVETLRNLIDTMPDSRSRGQLFEWYQRARLGRTLDIPEGTALLPPAQPNPEMVPGTRGGRDMPDGKSADDVVDITGTMAGDDPPPVGTTQAVDDKAGPGAFRDAQARRYIENLLEHEGKLADRNGVLLDGLIYRCSDDKTADAVLKGLARIVETYPGGLSPEQREYLNIRVVVLQSDGSFRARATDHLRNPAED